jgi:hypothetical protein
MMVSNNMKQKLKEMREETDKPTMLVEDLNTCFLATDGTT